MIKRVVVIAIFGVCQTSFATTNTDLAEQVCKDAVESAQLAEKTEKDAVFSQCMEQLIPQLEDEEATEAPLQEPQDGKRY